MTVQPTRDQLRALAARAADDGYTGNDNYGHLTVSPAVLTAILDALDQAEAELDSWMARAYEAEGRAWRAERRISRLEAQTDIRGRAVVMYRERAREAEARIRRALDN